MSNFYRALMLMLVISGCGDDPIDEASKKLDGGVTCSVQGTMTITVDNGTPTTYSTADAQVSNASYTAYEYGCEPTLYGTLTNPGNNIIRVGLCIDYNADTFNCDSQAWISVETSETAILTTYDLQYSWNSISFDTPALKSAETGSFPNDSGNGSVTLTQVDDVGGRIKGSFNFTAKNENDGNKTVNVIGSFDVQRTD